MSKPVVIALGIALGISIFVTNQATTAAQGAAAAPSSPPTNEWLTWGYDQERTLWNRAEIVEGHFVLGGHPFGDVGRCANVVLEPPIRIRNLNSVIRVDLIGLFRFRVVDRVREKRALKRKHG